jgi:hypothetical protein
MNLLFALLLAAPTKLAFVTGPGQTGTGVCSAKVTVELEDANNVTATAPAPVSLILSGPDGYYSAADCTGPIIDPNGGLTIPMGGSNASFYFLHPHVGSVPLAVSSDQYAAVTQSWAVVAAPGVAMGITWVSNLSVGVKQGDCSAPLSYVLHDINGALVTAPRTITVNYSPADFIEFYPDASCRTHRLLSVDLPAGSSGSQISLRGSLIGAYTVRASSPGLEPAQVQVLIGGGSQGCASAQAFWPALALLPLLRRRRSR